MPEEYKAIEKIAQQKLVDMVPDELRDIFEPLIDEHHYSEEEQSIVKQADALCAYLKCLEELSAGNNEFLLAKGRLEKTLASRRSAEMDYFMQVFVPSFQLSLDEISRGFAAVRFWPGGGCALPGQNILKRKQYRDQQDADHHHQYGKGHAYFDKIAK